MKSKSRTVFLFVGVVAMLSISTPASGNNGHPWDIPFPAFIVVADNGLLIVASGGPFTCSWGGDGDACAVFTVMPSMDLWGPCFVDDPDMPLVVLHWRVTPMGATNASWTDNLWVEVYAEDELSDFVDDPCAYKDLNSPVAQGWLRWNFSDADDGTNGPGANSWGFRARGFLDNLAVEGCSSSTVRFDLLRRFLYLAEDANYALTVVKASKGPSMFCRD